jgi:dCMP deaminase
MWIEHSERNAIYNAARVGVSLKGCTLYTNGLPCAECARAVNQVGIDRIIIDGAWDKGATRPQWKESHACSMTMLQEAKILISVWNGELLQPVKFLSGQFIQ